LALGLGHAPRKLTYNGKEKAKATETIKEESSEKGFKEGFKQKSFRPKVIIGVNNISSVKLPDYVTEVLNLGANFQISSIPTKQEQEESWRQTWGQIQEKNLEIILDSPNPNPNPNLILRWRWWS